VALGGGEGLASNSDRFAPEENNAVPIEELGARGGAVVEALRYKPEGRGIDSRWCYWNFYWHNPSGRTMALGSTQSLTE
jgi:hypothetical protein